jgi:hypothetical protein
MFNHVTAMATSLRQNLTVPHWMTQTLHPTIATMSLLSQAQAPEWDVS